MSSDEFETRDNCSGLSENEISSLGNLHNGYLDTLFQKCKGVADSSLTDSLRAVAMRLNMNFSVIGRIKSEIIDSALSYASILSNANFKIDKIPSSFFYSIPVKNYTSKIIAVSDTSKNLVNFECGVDSIMHQAKIDLSLSCIELEYIEGIISISKGSYYYWAPTDKGGLNSGAFRSDQEISIRTWSWKKAFIADVASGATHMLGNAVVWSIGLATPGTNVAILSAWAISTAIGSAWGGLM